MGYLTFKELNREQLVSLKQAYLARLDDEGTLNTVLYGADDERCLTYGELANADELVPDDVIEHEYEGVVFTDEDF